MVQAANAPRDQGRQLTVITGATIGLLRDGEVLAAALRGEVDCHSITPGPDNGYLRWKRWRRRLARWAGRGAAPPLVFMERLYENWMQTSPYCIWIPNLEWVDPQSAELMGRCTEVWCKTRQAEQVILQRGGRARYIGFSSLDCARPEVPKDFNRFLHVAGRSQLKGTEAVVAAWLQHPSWPRLTVVARPPACEPRPAPNIEYLTGLLSDEELSTLMNACGVHVCPSRSEGFGHYIIEALSTGAVTLTTDAPPMNEHLAAGEGLLVATGPSTPLKWSECYSVSADSVTHAVEAVLAMPTLDKAAMGLRARQRYLVSRADFERRVRAAAAGLFEPQGRPQILGATRGDSC